MPYLAVIMILININYGEYLSCRFSEYLSLPLNLLLWSNLICKSRRLSIDYIRPAFISFFTFSTATKANAKCMKKSAEKHSNDHEAIFCFPSMCTNSLLNMILCAWMFIHMFSFHSFKMITFQTNFLFFRSCFSCGKEAFSFKNKSFQQNAF